MLSTSWCSLVHQNLHWFGKQTKQTKYQIVHIPQLTITLKRSKACVISWGKQSSGPNSLEVHVDLQRGMSHARKAGRSALVNVSHVPIKIVWTRSNMKQMRKPLNMSWHLVRCGDGLVKLTLGASPSVLTLNDIFWYHHHQQQALNFEHIDILYIMTSLQCVRPSIWTATSSIFLPAGPARRPTVPATRQAVSGAVLEAIAPALAACLPVPVSGRGP